MAAGDTEKKSTANTEDQSEYGWFGSSAGNLLRISANRHIGPTSSAPRIVLGERSVSIISKAKDVDPNFGRYKGLSHSPYSYSTKDQTSSDVTRYSIMSFNVSHNLTNGVMAHDKPLVKDDRHHESLPVTLPHEYVEVISKLPKLTENNVVTSATSTASPPSQTATSHSWGFASGQNHDEGSYHYQLAFMVYAAGAAHYPRLPALRSVFRSLQKLISKMLRPEVRGYWYLTSQSGPRLDPDL